MSTHCSSCGSPIPEGQGSSCSMCYGDPSYGRDMYYQRWIEQSMADEQPSVSELPPTSMDTNSGL